MREHSKVDRPADRQRAGELPAAGAGARPPGSSAANALALQRLAGNRATARTLTRWAAHPDKDKKGVLMPDVVAAEYLRFNPPKNQ